MVKAEELPKLATGIEGFDTISKGGLPLGRTTLVAGTSGSAKTIFASQFLVQGIVHQHEGGVFVTLEESPKDLRQNMAGFGWNIEHWEAEDMWAFVDGSPRAGEDSVVVGEFDFGALIARIEDAVRRTKATRVALDSLGSVFTRFPSASSVRRELFRVSAALKEMGVTSVLTVERTEEYGDISRYGVEEFVADNVVILRNVLEEQRRRRTMEILKFRGTTHHKGEYSFTILPGQGIVGVPLSAMELKQRSTETRITSGNEKLDAMCGGGFFQDSIILISGATGTGKTLSVSQFMAEGARLGQRCLLLAYEESHDQLVRNAHGWGYDFEQLEKEGLLRIECSYPETASLEDHLVQMKDLINEYKPQRVAVDSLSALERIATVKGFREFVISFSSFVKQHQIAGLLTATTPTLLGGSSATENHISTLTDTIVVLRYVELLGQMYRGLMVLKMRGSRHDKDIRQLEIDSKGMHIGRPFRNVSGILAGNPSIVEVNELERLQGLFRDESADI